MAESATPYYTKYPGYFGMKWHDDEDELKRWFDNWKVERYALFANRTEWLTIDEYTWTHRGRKVWRFEGVIGTDHDSARRKVRFETGAPAPPTFMLPVRQVYVPPKPQVMPWDNRAHRAFMEYEMTRQNYMMRSFSPYQKFLADVLPPVTPPPPRYRRN